jgi:mRNA-degrading endonuclease toxin of MazEF toxin-antitoxin module
MQKNFDKWNEIKKDIHLKNESKLYHAREIWWCSLGVNVGFEQDGDGKEYQRPVLVFKGFSANTCLIFPLTTSAEKHKMRISIGTVDGKEASIILSQPRIIDTKRLVEKVEFLDKEIFEIIRKAVKELL